MVRMGLEMTSKGFVACQSFVILSYFIAKKFFLRVKLPKRSLFVCFSKFYVEKSLTFGLRVPCDWGISDKMNNSLIKNDSFEEKVTQMVTHYDIFKRPSHWWVFLNVFCTCLHVLIGHESSQRISVTSFAHVLYCNIKFW